MKNNPIVISNEHTSFNFSFLTYINIFLFLGLMFSVGFNLAAVNENKKLAEVNYKLNEVIHVLESKYLDKEDEIILTKFQKTLVDHYDYIKEDNRRKREIDKIQNFITSISDEDLDEEYLKTISTAFYDASEKYELDYKELIAVAWHENRFHPTRKSNVGAVGVMQIMPLWVNRSAEFRSEIGAQEVSDLENPVLNIFGGAFIYRKYYDYWDNKIKDKMMVRKLALLSYNRGKNKVRNLLKQGKNPENNYSIVVLSKLNKINNLEKNM
ncbi:MAG: transglycosylase SLT domain-containing protein [Gammaproteobacteria bacterium]|nr:transglycosylase SLT domain-containing protein [Gammaproteobacteria bacterium]